MKVLDKIKELHEDNKDIIFTFCYFRENLPAAILNIFKPPPNYWRDDEVLPFLIDGVVEASIGFGTLYKLLDNKLDYVPEVYDKKPDLIIKNEYR